MTGERKVVYTASLQHDGHAYYLGRHEIAANAAYARDCAARHFYGELARLNGVPKPEGYEWDQEIMRLVDTQTQPISIEDNVEYQKFVGVSNLFTKTQGASFQAHIKWKGKSKNFGTYKSPEVAAYARDCAAKMTGKQFVQMNNIPKSEGWEWDATKMRLAPS